MPLLYTAGQQVVLASRQGGHQAITSADLTLVHLTIVHLSVVHELELHRLLAFQRRVF